MRFEDWPAITTDLPRCCAPRLANTLHKLDRGRRAHLKALCSRSSRSSCRDTPHDPPAQILGQRCRHRELHRSKRPNSYESQTADSVQPRTALNCSSRAESVSVKAEPVMPEEI